jgi:hypothetical protein
MTTHPNRIDLYHRLIPPAFVSAMEAKGMNEVAGAPLPHWTPTKSIETMDAHGIATAILSPSGVDLDGSRHEACDLAWPCNAYAADLANEHPATPFTAESCREAGHALDVLQADGVVLLGSTTGYILGDPCFDALMAELDRRKAVVFVHPNLHKISAELGLPAPGFLVEFVCDTTRAATNLILTGTVEKYPHIRWILTTPLPSRSSPALRRGSAAADRSQSSDKGRRRPRLRAEPVPALRSAGRRTLSARARRVLAKPADAGVELIPQPSNRALPDALSVRRGLRSIVRCPDLPAFPSLVPCRFWVTCPTSTSSSRSRA